MADVDTVRHEHRRHAALAQARGHVGVAGDDDGGAATPPCELCRLDFARVARVRGEAVRHAELGRGARRNLRRRVREVAVHTRDVGAAQVRGDGRGLLARGACRKHHDTTCEPRDVRVRLGAVTGLGRENRGQRSGGVERNELAQGERFRSSVEIRSRSSQCVFRV